MPEHLTSFWVFPGHRGSLPSGPSMSPTSSLSSPVIGLPWAHFLDCLIAMAPHLLLNLLWGPTGHKGHLFKAICTLKGKHRSLTSQLNPVVVAGPFWSRMIAPYCTLLSKWGKGFFEMHWTSFLKIAPQESPYQIRVHTLSEMPSTARNKFPW